MRDTNVGCLILRWMFFLFFFAVVSGCAARSPVPAVHAADDARKADFNEKVTAAIEKAKKEGQTDINLYVDENGVSEEKPGEIQVGDLVEFNFTLTTENGVLLKTNVAAEAAKRHSSAANMPDGMADEIKNEIYSPEPVMINPSKGGVLDISGKLTGLKPGDRKHMVLEPDKGGLPRDPARIKPFSRFKRVPLVITMKTADFKNQFGIDPHKGARVAVAPSVTAKIRRVKDGNAVLDVDYKKDKDVTDALGRTRIRKDGGSLVIELIPDIGAPFEVNTVRGHITSMDETNFYVDFNPPGAGRNIVLDVEILSLVKASQVRKQSIAWVEDYKKGLETMKQTGKPMVLFLYRKGCPWCGRMESDVLPSPLIRSLSADYVWVKIDSEQNPEIKDMFRQEGFPMTVLMNTDQSVYGDLKGFRDARKMRKELRLWEDDLKTGKKTGAGGTAGTASPDECRG